MKWISDRKIWALALIFYIFGLTSYGQSFTEVAATVNAQIGNGAKDGGLAWADLNQDGYLDLLVNTNNNTGYSRVLFWNSGTNQYDDVTATHAPDLLLTVCERSALTGDFDNDGDIDFMRSHWQRLEIYENLGPLAATPYSFSLKQVVDVPFFTGPGTQTTMNNEGLAWMDFDGDGDLDVYMEDHQMGQDILENDGTGVFTHYTPDSDPKGFPTTGSSGDYSVTADLDNNGDVDIVARRQGTSAALQDVDIFMNNSDGTFTDNNTLNLETRNGFKGGVAVADFDLDGDFDYFWTNNGTSSGNVTHVIAEQTGVNSGNFALATVSITPAPAWTGLEIEGIAMGDVNNDGKIDIFLAPDSGPGYLLINTTTGGTFSFTHSNSGINLAGDGEGAAMGDYDNDGDLDLYVNIQNGNNQLWENDLGGNTDYLKVEPLIDLGGGITRSATGATAVLELKGCTNLRFIQEVSGGVGHGSQNDPRLHFGLPDGPNVQYKVTVSFVRPNGGGRTIVEKYVTPSAQPNQTIQIRDTDVSDADAHPNGVDDSFTVARNSSNNALDVLNNDTDPNAEDLTISLLSGATSQGGTVSVNDNGTPVDPTDDFVEYTPAASFSGVDNFTYYITNQSGFCSSADVTITVNTPPTADNNTVSTPEDVTYTFSAADFTVNYNDANGDPFAEIRITSLESVGSLLLGGSPVALNDVITVAQLAANQLTFVPVADQFGSPYDSFDFEVGDGLNFSTSDYTLTVNVTSVNDLPTGDNNTVSTNEDVTYVFAVADFTVNYSDPESDPFAEIRITSLESVGDLLLGGSPVALNDVITAAQISGGQLTFVPQAGQSGSPYDTFDFEVGDGSDFSTADYTLTVNVTPVNDPPTGDDNTVSTNEDITYVFAVADFTVNYSDPESDPFAEIRITSLESVGDLLLGGSPVALNDVITAAQISGGQLTFVPQAGQSGSPYDTFDFEVGDGSDFSTADYTLNVNVTPVNDPPTGDDNTVSTNEDITYVFAVADFTVNYSDPESDPFAEIRITSLESVGDLLLGGSPVALNDVITAAQISGGQLTFVPVANQNGSPYDTFDFEVGDGSDFSTSDNTLTVNVTPVNDPPTGDDNTVSTNEDITYVFAAADFTVNYSDPESDPFAEIRITSLESVGDLLLGGSPVALNDVITAAQISGGQLTFVPQPGQSGSPYDSFDFEVGDGADFSISDYTLTVNVTPVNDPPTGDDNTVSTNEDITYVFAVADFTVNYSDPESDPFDEIRITSLESVGDLLLGGSPVALNDVITAAQISGGQLTFVPQPGQSGSPYDTFDFEVGDGSDFSTADYTLTVNVTPVNDPPTGDDNTVSTNEDITYVFAVADFTVNYNDPESDPFDEIRITGLESTGDLLLGGSPVALNDVITAAQISGGQLTFVPQPGQSGSPYDSFDFEVGDGSDFSTSDYTLTVNVTPVNDPPTGDNNTVSTNEDITYVFAVADFTVNYSDPESDPFAEIRITSLESVGDLLLGGSPVALNDVITAAQIIGGQLTFVPQPGQSGSPYDTFDFEVGDGSDFSTADYTLTVNVTPVNDPPTGDDNTVSTNEDITYVFAVADFTVNYSDPESDPFAEIRITSLESVGDLLLGGSPVALNDVITAAQISGGQLTFVPQSNQSGSPYDSFDFEVGDGSNFSTSDYTLTVNVTPVNDPPTGDDNTVATNEDITYVFAVADFTVNYSDPESDPLDEIRITSLESVGDLLLGGSPVALNDVITAAQISGGQLTFVPQPGQSGSPYDSFDFEVGDGSDFSTSDYTLTVNVTPVNDPPTGDDNTVSTNEDITYVFAVADFTVNYSDPENDPFAEIRITSLESVGDLLLGGSPVALNDVITAAQISGGQLTFVPQPGQSGSPYDTFDFEVGDGSDFSTADYTLTVNVAPVNDPPTGDDNTVSTNEDITYVFAVADFTVNYSDPESDPFAEIRITSLESVGDLLLGGSPVALNDVITAAQISGGQLTFVPVANQNGSPYDTFDFEVADGSDFSTADYTLTVNVTPVNDPPSGSDNTVLTQEDINYVFTVADFTVSYSDPESDPFAEIRITSLESVGDLLVGGSPVALNDVITAAQIAGGQLVFVPLPGQSGSPYDTFDFEVGDGSDFSNTDYTLTVNVGPVNDPPTGDDNTVTTNEDVTYVFTVADFTVNYSDPESDPFNSIRVTSLESVGNLLFNGTPVTLNQTITAADIGNGLLTFVPIANQSGSPYDSFDFEVGDAVNYSVSDYTLTINVLPVNDPPTGDYNTVSTSEDINYVFAVADFTVNYSDPESDPFAEIRITSLESVGDLLLGGSPVALNDVITTAQISGGQLTFVPQPGQSGSPYDTFDFEVGDGSDFSTADYTLTVNVTPVNDPPTGDDNTVTTNEDITYVFAVADFTVNYSDPESDPFAEIRITSLESVGDLLLGGSPVGLNDVITAAQISGGQLTFVPQPGQSGSPYDSFDFEVGDGSDFSTSDYTLTVNVTPVNDPPSGDNNTVSTNEDITYVFAGADFTVNYSDPESDPFDEIRITSLESVGDLLLGGSPVALNDVITAAQISGGQLTFVAQPNQNGSPYDSFDFEVGDGSDFSTADYTLTVNVTPVNDPPSGGDNSVLTQEDITYVFTVADFTVSYSDPESDPFDEIRITSLESVGDLLLGGSPVALNDVITAAQISGGQLTFVPLPGQSGLPYDNFDFEVGDGSDFSTSDYTLTVNVGPVNDPPTGDNNTVTTNEDVNHIFTIADFTVNYSDPESDPFSSIRVTSLESTGNLLYNGSPVTLNQIITATDIGNGLLTFIPQPDQSGSPYDSFDFEVGDAFNYSASDYTLTINVTPINDGPSADNNTVSTNEDVTYTFAVADFTVNYSDLEGDPFAGIRITSLESVGDLLLGGSPVALNDVITAAQISGGQLTFVPVADQNGSPYDSFDFEVSDGSDFSITDYTLTVNVNPVNDAPVASDNAVNTPEDVTYVFNAADFTVGYSDLESDPFAEIRITNLESVGDLLLGGTPVAINDIITVAQISGGQLTFVPVAGQNGSPYDSFEFEVGDGADFSLTAYTMTINVGAVNDPPIGIDFTLTIDEDVTHNFGTGAFTAGYNDPEGDPFASIRITQLPGVGTLLYNGVPVVINQVISAADILAGLVDFVPLPGQSGSPYDTFQFEVGDGTNFSVASYTLTINVNPVNDIPVAVNDNPTTPEEIAISIDVLVNDDLGDTPTSISSIDGTTTAGGTAVINNNGTPADPSDDFVDYTPPTGFNGIDTFTYTIQDNDGETSVATVSVTVTPINDTPLAVDDNAITNEDAATTIDVLINDNLGDTPTAISNVDNSTAQGGTASINDNGTPGDTSDDFIDYTPAPNFNGVDNFNYTIQDDDGETSTATVTITVNGINDTPLAVDDNSSTDEDLAVAVDVLSNDNLGDEPTTIIMVDGITTEGGTAQINDNGTPGDSSDDFIDFTPANGFTGTDTFTYTIEDMDGERSTATVTIDISLAPSTLVIYKGFSPNGDGSNDEWVIDGILFYPGNTVQVFNRWGNLVYKETGYDNQTRVWYGQSNAGWIVGDNILPDGTYFYMVDLGDGSEVHSGYVMLKR